MSDLLPIRVIVGPDVSFLDLMAPPDMMLPDRITVQTDSLALPADQDGNPIGDPTSLIETFTMEHRFFHTMDLPAIPGLGSGSGPITLGQLLFDVRLMGQPEVQITPIGADGGNWFEYEIAYSYARAQFEQFGAFSGWLGYSVPDHGRRTVLALQHRQEEGGAPGWGEFDYSAWQDGSLFSALNTVFLLSDGGVFRGGTGETVFQVGAMYSGFANAANYGIATAPFVLQAGTGPRGFFLFHTGDAPARIDRIEEFGDHDWFKVYHADTVAAFNGTVTEDLIGGYNPRLQLVPDGDGSGVIYDQINWRDRGLRAFEIERFETHALLHAGADDVPGAEVTVRLEGNHSNALFVVGFGGAVRRLSVGSTEYGEYFGVLDHFVGVETEGSPPRSVLTQTDAGEVNLYPNHLIRYGDTLETGSNNALRMVGFDGSRVTIGTNSDYTIEVSTGQNSGSVIHRLRNGILNFFREPGGEGEHQIITSTTVIGVRGTELTVDHNEATGTTTVSVMSGSVEIEDLGTGDVTLLGAGESGSFGDGTGGGEGTASPEDPTDPPADPTVPPGFTTEPRDFPTDLPEPSRIRFGDPIYLNAPLGADWGLGQVEWERSVAVDITGDGRHEVVISTTPDGSNNRPEEASPLVVLGWRDGALVELSAELLPGPVGGSIVRNFVTGDFNGDGITDILVNNHGTEAFQPFPGERNVLLLSDGNGRYADATGLLPDFTDFSHGSVAADFTGNGHVDLFINNLGERDNNISYLLVNDGAGGFSAPHYYNSLFGRERSARFDETFEWTNSAYHAELFDYGGNGVFDIYMGYVTWFGPPEQAPNTLGFAVAVNDGAGNFTLVYDDALAPAIPAEMWRSGDVASEMTRAGDVTGNGLIDLLVLWSGPDLTYLQLLENRGAEGYVDVSHRIGGQEDGRPLPHVVGTPDVFLIDFDDDGDLDILLTRWSPDFSEQRTLWFENDGAGNFSWLDPASFPGTIQSSVADVNGDGIPDIVYMVSGWDLPELDPSGLNYAAVRLGERIGEDPPPDPTRIIGGTVVDRAGNELPGSVVTFAPATGAPIFAATDPAGAFAFQVGFGTAGHLDVTRDVGSGDSQSTAVSALETLRLAVGLNPSWGPARPMDFIAADINQDGQVTVSDALEVLRAAVGLPSANPPRWIFLDDEADLSEVSRTNTAVGSGLRLDSVTTDVADLSLVGILLGNMQEWA